MLIRLSYDIQFDIPAPLAMVAMLNVHPSRNQDLLEPDELHTEPSLEVTSYFDTFGNRCTRFVAPAGHLRLNGSTLIRDDGQPDVANWSAREPQVGDLPNEILCFLLNSRYCEVDRFSSIAFELFGQVQPGWGRVQAICDWVHRKVEFNYQHARPYQDCARCLHRTRRRLPRLPASRHHLLPRAQHPRPLRNRLPRRTLASLRAFRWISAPGSRSYLDGRWWTFDARNNMPRIGRILMATGRDASDVAMTTSFGSPDLRYFFVVTDEE